MGAARQVVWMRAQQAAELQGWAACCEEDRLRADWALEERLADVQRVPRCDLCGAPGCLYCHLYVPDT